MMVRSKQMDRKSLVFVLFFTLLVTIFHYSTRSTFDDQISVAYFEEEEEDDTVNSNEAPEPYPYLHGYKNEGNTHIEESPDPFVSYTWSESTNASQLQIYRVSTPVSYRVIPNDARVIDGLDDQFVAGHFHNNSFKIYHNCTIVMDWGVERAAWMELQSPMDLQQQQQPHARGYQVLASLSEFNEPYPGKTKELVRYGKSTYRLETNPQLYEGVRFTFLFITIFEPMVDERGFVEISDISLVAKIKPVNYTGTFRSSNPTLTQAWYTGAYGVRLNMEENEFNSVLVERGDRVAIQGDGHPTIDAALVAFSPFSLVKNVLQQTDSSHKHVVDDSIMAYPLYWCLSSIDYYMASADENYFLQTLTTNIRILLDKRINDFLDPKLDITWFGWDDRIGNGWCFHSNNDTCTREAHLAFAALVIRVSNDFARALHLSGQFDLSIHYSQQSLLMSQKLRNVPEYPDGLGVHAVANVVNAAIVATSTEIQHWMSTTLNDPITICSFSQFNQYWILQAFGNLVGEIDAMERALASILLCWGPMMTLGKGCFWELSSPEWLRLMKDGDAAPHTPSYCHPWASGVTPWLSHVHAGLIPIQPGYKEFAAIPYVSATHPWVSASLMTPLGTIAVNASLDESLSLHVTMNSTVPGIVGIPSQVLGWDGKFHQLVGTSSLNSGEHAALISYQIAKELLGPKAGRQGSYSFWRFSTTDYISFAASYGGELDLPRSAWMRDQRGTNSTKLGRSPFPEPNYPARTDPLDRKSQGNGLWKYGKDGFILFGCDSNEGDVRKLPDLVDNVTVIRHGFPGYVELKRDFLGYSDINPTYLPLSGRRDRSIGKRGLGRIRFNDMGAGDINCILMDIHVKEEFLAKPFSMSIYSVAESQEQRHAIRVMDGTTYNVIAPTPLIDAFVDGVWWTVHYNSSLRLKFMDMRGISISAVAFSSIES